MAGKKVLIVYAHQEPKSFNGSLKNLADEVLSKQGCSVTISDLYAMDFKPAATRSDIIGELYNPDHFNYRVECFEAYKKGRLAKDVLEEQKKVLDANLVIFQIKKALLSLTTGGDEGMYLPTGANGDIKYLLWSMQHGMMHFCGFQVLAPNVCYGMDNVTEEKRKEMLDAWAHRLQKIWEEKPINCQPSGYFR
ncbi:ribosyldihydronicotinamide dehydrogenase [quinone] [Latimeria chalumnae]|uniref:ribosyldihydronicotinamide dehydrogenase [quinone] n=1 Tax=Latimeria chalumnae TaxID=7897 RepID=UPI00313E211D